MPLSTPLVCKAYTWVGFKYLRESSDFAQALKKEQ